MRVALAQINSAVGDIEGNARRILSAVKEAEQKSSDLCLIPELGLTGYPPEDLVLKPAFIDDNLAALKALARQIKKTVAVVGFIDEKNGQPFNAAAWIEKGRVTDVYRKRCLPNYGVFDEKRYFSPGERTVVKTVKGLRVGLTICEDIWIFGDHLQQLKKLKPDVTVNISASPFHIDKLQERHAAFKKNVRYLKTPLVYCNLTGGQDELVFDGGSFATDAAGDVRTQFPQFQAGVHVIDIDKKRAGFAVATPEAQTPALNRIEQIHRALVMGVTDYVGKNNFSRVALGLSGGIDSALVAALAAQALGPQNVVGVSMPTRYNLSETRNDARRVAENLGIGFYEIPIQPVFEAMLKALEPLFKGTEPNLAEENLQSRIRGNLLMALSNKFGWLVISTGNKSEVSTGYCTLYGDTAGGFAPLKDVLKTTVYDLARHLNAQAGRELIPQSTIDRAPTAELRENQKDEDSLGSYSELDSIIVDYVEKNRPFAVQKKKHAGREDHLRKILLMIDRNEYKRRQAPPGVKITPRSFGRDHRMPITNRYRSA